MGPLQQLILGMIYLMLFGTLVYAILTAGGPSSRMRLSQNENTLDRFMNCFEILLLSMHQAEVRSTNRTTHSSITSALAHAYITTLAVQRRQDEYHQHDSIRHSSRRANIYLVLETGRGKKETKKRLMTCMISARILQLNQLHLFL